MKKILLITAVLALISGCRNDDYQKIEEELLTERIKKQERYKQMKRRKHDQLQKEKLR